MNIHPMRQQIAFRQYNPNKPHCYGLLLKEIPYTYKAVTYVAKPKTGNGPYDLEPTIDYIEYLLTKMEADQPITSRSILTDSLYTNIESTNWLLDHSIVTVRTLQKGWNEIPSELFDFQNREIFSATCHFEKKKMSQNRK